jgi:hypothetical protein
MFVQILQGKVADAEALRRQWDEWIAQQAADAVGWQGSTAGITPDGEWVGVARFESEEAARRNSDRPEQGEWWARTEACFDGPVVFHDSNDVQLLLEGGSDNAGFVQVMQGRASDRDRFEVIEEEAMNTLPELRPDIIGGLRAWYPDGRFTDVIWFTSEAEAREGERKELPEHLKASFEEWTSLVEDIRWYDLNDPWLASP